MQRDRDVAVPHRDASLALELVLQAESALKPFCAFLRIAHRQSEVTDSAQDKWSLHRPYISAPAQDRLRKRHDGQGLFRRRIGFAARSFRRTGPPVGQ